MPLDVLIRSLPCGVIHIFCDAVAAWLVIVSLPCKQIHTLHVSEQSGLTRNFSSPHRYPCWFLVLPRQEIYRSFCPAMQTKFLTFPKICIIWVMNRAIPAWLNVRFQDDREATVDVDG